MRNLAAILAGYVTAAVLILVPTLALVALFQPMFDMASGEAQAWAAATIVLSCIAIVAGGYVTATFARENGLQHALTLGVMMSLLGMVPYSFLAEGAGPLAFKVVLAALALPAAVLGGFLRVRAGGQARWAA